MKHITRTVWVLSLISLFTDAASEMLYPVMPMFLKSIGFTVFLIGILEGIAEAVAGLSKGYFGRLSDSMGKRVPFVQAGYALSSLSKPLLAILSGPIWVFVSRTGDRIGKGIRTGARDAMLANESTPANRASIFGFHRSMDTLGAVLGPLMALGYLYYNPGSYKALFAIALIPGILAILTSFLLKERAFVPTDSRTNRVRFFEFLGYWKKSPPLYRQLVTGLLLFALVNSSDVFLLLKARDSGLNETAVVGIYIFYNLVYAIAAFPIGILADRIGFKWVFILGLLFFALVYAGMTIATSWVFFLLLFFMYGLYAAATEGVGKAWISLLSKKEDTATAIGCYTAFQSIASLLASSLTGFIWFRFGAATAFLLPVIVSFFLCFYFARIGPTLKMPNE